MKIDLRNENSSTNDFFADAWMAFDKKEFGNEK